MRRQFPELEGERLTLWERRTDSGRYPGDDDDGGAAGLKPAADCFSCRHAGFRFACRLLADLATGRAAFRRSDGSRLEILASLELVIDYRAIDPVGGDCPGFVIADDAELRRRAPGIDFDRPLEAPIPSSPDPAKKKPRKRKAAS